MTDWLALDKQICFALHAASRATVAAYRPLLEPLGLTYPQYLVMLVLWEGDGLSVKALGERLFLDSGTLTPLLKRLELAGLLVRARSSDDERVVEVRLTSRGRALRRRAETVPKALACAVGLAPHALGELRETLRNLTAVLHAHTAESESP